MDNLIENYSDSLSYIDNEYDNPIVKAYVDSMIKSEMASMPNSSKDYLAKLPSLPKLVYSVSNHAPVEIDMKRYELPAPEPPADNSIQGWNAAVSNAKSQIENQSNRLLNLELSEKNSSAVWLHYNSILEQSEKFLLKRNEDLYKQINDINYDRKETQENVKAELDKILRRRDESIMKSWHIEVTCKHMENSLSKMKNTSQNIDTNPVNKRVKLGN